MSITLELTPAEEARLREAAEAHNLDLPTFLKQSGLQAAQRDADLKTRWHATESMAKTAVRNAQKVQLAQGVSLVYEKDGVVVEELPDGTIRPLSNEAH